MKIVKPIISLRRKAHVDTRLEIRDEKTHAYRLMPWLAIVNISFGFVDWVVSGVSNPFRFFFVRVCAVVAARVMYLLLRGRARYGLRLLVTVGPYICGVEYIMMSEGWCYSPYFAGASLVMITSTMLFPVRSKIALVVYSLCIIPVLIWIPLHTYPSIVDACNLAMMSLGSVLVCAVNSGQVWNETRKLFLSQEDLARDLGKREKEIRKKAEELLRRKTFESQFSPQVVTAVLQDPASVREMRQQTVSVLVIDLKSSTDKAQELSPNNYRFVVEEVFDTFASACVKWNVTIDKFTGDGAQAFAGAPVTGKDDLRRAIFAARDSIKMIHDRLLELEMKWNGKLDIRLAVAEGPALVGFFGRGFLKSYTAISETVSLAHRLCGEAEPWTVWVHSKGDLNADTLGEEIGTKMVTGLKGFGADTFRIRVVKPKIDTVQIEHVGRCNACQTPLILEDAPNGLPRLVCPACQDAELRSNAA